MKIIGDAQSLDLFLCDWCGGEIPTPYGEPERTRRFGLVCSTCAGADWLEWKEKKALEEHTPDPDAKPIICLCGFKLEGCHAGTCDIRKREKKAGTKQLELF